MQHTLDILIHVTRLFNQHRLHICTIDDFLARAMHAVASSFVNDGVALFSNVEKDKKVTGLVLQPTESTLRFG